MTNSEEQQHKIYPATVVKIIDEYKVVINRGIRDGIKNGQRFLVYKVDDQELVDPDTGENLGQLEIIRGIGKVVHLQEKLATIESAEYDRPRKTVIRRKSPGFPQIFGRVEEEESYQNTEELLAFDAPEIGDKVKPV